MPLPERTIERAIDGLKKSPGKFQRLIESYIYLSYPHQFTRIIPQGRNSSDVPVKGWPDIYSLNPSFRLNVVEVTHSPAWSAHLEEDVAKAEALGPGQLSGFIFVAWANEPSPLTINKRKNQQKGKRKSKPTDKEKNPQYDQMVGYYNRLVALGIPPDNINFVFKKQLIRTLSQPRFANVLTMAELPSNCTPFRPISQTPEIFGTSPRYDVFAPSKEEYQNRLVHRSAITDEVEQRLSSLGWAYVRGRGAAGKTVLGIHIGLAYESRSLPAYYLDLVRTDASVADALSVITTHSDDGVLFIIDNVHLNQGFARDCFDHWQSVGAGSHLLLMGRDTAFVDYRGTALSLDDLRAESLMLEVTQEDLEGVFLRLARRVRSSPDLIQRPPQDALQLWLRHFGGDLIAFSAAVAHRVRKLGKYDWTIRAQDATTYMRRAYLERANEAEQLNLLRLAVSAQLEVDVPEEAFDVAQIDKFLQNGLVHSVERGSEKRYGYYRLVHPGLGDLLLAAANYSDEELKRFISEQYGYIAYRNPYAATFIAARLESSSRVQEAASILKGVLELENGFERTLITPGIQFFRSNTERLTRLGVLSEPEIEEKLASLTSALNTSVLRASLHFLPAFLQYSEEKLPNLYASLVAMFQRTDSVKALTESALQTHLGDLASFLKYVEGKQPRLYALVVASLEQPDSVKGLIDSMLRTPIYYLPSFFEHAARKLPQLYAALIVALEQSEGIIKLSELTFRTPLHFLPAFFDYTERKLPNLYLSLAALLETSESVKRMTEGVLQRPLGDLAGFLEYAARKLPNLYTSFVAVLEQHESVKAINELVLRTPLQYVSRFLDFAAIKLPDLYKSLVPLLSGSESAKALVDTALRSSLGEVVRLLNYAEGELPELYNSLVGVFEQPRSAERLSVSVLQTSLGDLAGFLKYADGKLPQLYASLVAVLEQPASIKILTESALRAPLPDLVLLLEYAEEKLHQLYSSLMAVLEQPGSVKILSENALRASLADLALFLQNADGKLHRLHTLLMAELEQPGSVRILSESALRTPLPDLALFLRNAEEKLLTPYNALVDVLDRSPSAARLGESALETALGHLPRFFRYAEGKLPQVYTSIVATLERPENAHRMTENVLRTPLRDLVFFLQYAEEKLPKFYASLVTVLEQPESARRLSESAQQTALGELAFFLEYADVKLPLATETITNRLTDPATIDFLADTACHAPLDSLRYFFQRVTFASAVIQAIDREQWDKCRLQYVSEQLESFPAMARLFQFHGRPELGEAPAIALIRSAEQQQWNSLTVGLHHLAHVMRLGRAAGQDSIQNFMTCIVTPSWLNGKYEKSPTYGIAAALFSLWAYHDDAILSRFNTRPLRSRVIRKLNYLGKLTPEELFPALRLIGVSVLVGARVGTINTTWPKEDCINQTIRIATPSSEATTMNSAAIQLWLGLRVMAGIRSDQIQIQPDQAEVALRNWKNSTGYTDKQNALNKSMIDWMDRCSESGWRLIADRQRATS